MITFYSYKGGVGRSFALVNTATMLSMWGFRVLCVDWDLEAPGLDAYFGPVLARPPSGGLADVFTSFAAGVTEEPDQYVVPVVHEAVKGRLDLLPAGAGDGYVRLVQRLDWAAMYQDRDLGDQLEKWRARWIEDYDFVLIDSRTGITDIGGICTAQMPDVLVTMFTANEQSIRGILDVARRADDARDRLPYDRPRLMVLPVPSRFEGREEYQQAAYWRERFVTELTPLLNRWVSRTVPVERLLGYVTVPYISFWSFGEHIAALKEPSPTPDEIMYSLQTIAALVAHRLDGTDALADARDAYVAAAARAGRRSSDTLEKLVGVFLSYRTEDRGLARVIAGALADRGLRVVDPASAAHPGGSATAHLREQLGAVPLMVCVLGDRMSAAQGQEIEVFARHAGDGEPERVLVAVTPTPMLSVLAQGRQVTVDMESTPQATAARVADAVEFEAAAILDRRLRAHVRTPGPRARLELLRSAVRLGGLAERQSDPVTAGAAYRSVLATLAEGPPEPAAGDVTRIGAHAHSRLGRLAWAQDEFRDAADRFRAAADLYRQSADADRDDVRARKDLSAALLSQSHAHRRLGEEEAAERAGGQAVTVLADLVARDGADLSSLQSLRDAHAELGSLREARGDLDAAMESYRAALELDGRLVGAAPADVRSLENLATSLLRIADLARDLARFELADGSYRDAAEIYGRLLAGDPGNARYLRGLAGLHRQAGDSSASVPDLVAAGAHYDEARQLYQALVDAHPADGDIRRELGLIHLRRGDIEIVGGMAVEALDRYRAALGCFEALSAADPARPQNRRDVGVTLNKLGDVAVMLDDLDTAAAAYRRGLEINQALAAMDRADVNPQRDLSTSHAKLGDLALARGDRDAARVSYRAALTIAQRTYGMDAVALDLRGKLRSIDPA
jgi:tetratricopeptide (TPR) repeat protein/cellulose biosynthesis protein BcsQ